MAWGLSKIIFFTLLAGATIAGTSHAQDGIITPLDIEDGFYISGFIGAVFPGDASFSGEQNPPIGAPIGAGTVGDSVNINLDFGTDVNYGGALGVQAPFLLFGVICPRFELEVNYFKADVDNGSTNGGNQAFSGDQSNLFVFVNYLNDIRWKEEQVIVPYFGGGLGIGIVDTDIQYFGAGAPFAPLPAFELNGSDTGFATHNILGLSYVATDRFEIYTEGRYLRTYGIDTERRFIGGNTVDIFNADVSDTLNGFTVTAGMRYRF